MPQNEITECSRCCTPMAGLKKTSDLSDVCFNCLTDDERDYLSSPEVQQETMRRLNG